MKEEGLIPETSTSTDDSLEPFKNGEAAMTVAASSNLAKVDGINWDYSILSYLKIQKTFVASDSLVLFNKCKKQRSCHQTYEICDQQRCNGRFP